MSETCKMCRFFFAPDADDYPGECRRRAPTIQIRKIDKEPISEWPRVYEFQWCGEYEKRKNY